MAVTYTLYYHKAVIEEDIPRLGVTEKERIRNAIKSKLQKDPATFSKPLRRSLRGYRSLRVGDWRVVFRIDIETSSVKILFIGHRSTIYDIAEKIERNQ